MEEYLQGFVKQIEYAFEHNIVGDATIAQQWSMVSDNGKLVLDRNTRNVLP